MRYFIRLSYDGKNYHGWQIQPGAITVQEVLNKALSTLLRSDIEVVGAGRTDAGVNASMMIAHFDILPKASLPRLLTEGHSVTPLVTTPEGEETSSNSSRMASPTQEKCKKDRDVLSSEDLYQLRYRLNKLLPQDIAIHDIYPVADNMHARFSATSRTYHYYILTEKSPFEPYAYRFPQPLDFDKMNEACKVLFDYIDFTSFSKLHTDVKTNNCKIMEARWEQVTPIKWQFTIKADRFLRNMVRAIVGTLIDVGRGAITIDDFRRIIEKKDRCSAGTSVPGNALFLCEVTYPDSHPDGIQMANK